VNVPLEPPSWETQQYTVKRRNLKEDLRNRYGCPWVNDICAEISKLHELLLYLELEAGVDEVMLLHGTTEKNAKNIVDKGSSECFGQRVLHGRGVYFMLESCQASQSCDSGSEACLLIAWVIVGHPFLTKGPIAQDGGPHCAEPGIPRDSTITKPRISKGKGSRARASSGLRPVSSSTAYTPRAACPAAPRLAFVRVVVLLCVSRTASRRGTLVH
jgi:hypothetical protein